MSLNLDAVLSAVETEREAQRYEGEKELSMPQWVQRIQQACREASQYAHQGDVSNEARTWVMVAALAAARAEVCYDFIDGQQVAAPPGVSP